MPLDYDDLAQLGRLTQAVENLHITVGTGLTRVAAVMESPCEPLAEAIYHRLLAARITGLDLPIGALTYTQRAEWLRWCQQLVDMADMAAQAWLEMHPRDDPDPDGDADQYDNRGNAEQDRGPGWAAGPPE